MILKYIIEQFVKTAQPVGSHALIEEYKLPYSSATIRNEMSFLENLDFLCLIDFIHDKNPENNDFQVNLW